MAKESPNQSELTVRLGDLAESLRRHQILHSCAAILAGATGIAGAVMEIITWERYGMPSVLAACSATIVVPYAIWGWFGLRSKNASANMKWPRVWQLFAFLLNHKIRARVYEPASEELLEDYLLARQFRTNGARAWIQFCFGVRTVLLFCACFRAMLVEVGLGVLLKVIPVRLKSWWLS